MTRRPLDGIIVVALEQAVAGPFATRQLADLGARVIKVERVDGDFARGYDTAVGGMSSYFVWLNRSKESVVLDLKSPEGAEALRRLIQRADVLVQNLAPGAVERLGFGAQECHELNRRLIHVSVSGYGVEGPYADRKAYDLLIQCEAGLLSVTGTPEEPAKVGVSIADIAAGMYAFSGVLSALLQRACTGRGETLEVSMLEALGEWMQNPALYTAYAGTPPARSGAHHASIAPYGPFDCLDGTVFLAVQNEREWRSLCSQVLGEPELADDPRFATHATRVRHRDALHERIGAHLRPLSVAQTCAVLDAAGVANAVLRDMAGFVDHPQLAARDRWANVDTPVGPVRMLRPVVTTDGWQHRMDPVPAVGEHTAAVLAELQHVVTANSEQ